MTDLPRFERLFLHFFDVHFLDLKGVSKDAKRIKQHLKNECRLATRFAILAANEVFIPAASFFESELCFEIVNELSEIYQFGAIYLVGGGSNLEEFMEEKLVQYAKSSHQFARYKALKKRPQTHPPFYPRTQSASKDIIVGWNQVLKSGNIGKITAGSDLVLPKDFEGRWAKVPERLGKRAFVVEHVTPLLLYTGTTSTIGYRLNSLINEHYFESFTQELFAGIVAELVYLEAPHKIPSFGKDLPYRSLLNEIRRKDYLRVIENVSASELLRLRENQVWNESILAACIAYEKKVSSSLSYFSLIAMKTLSNARIGIITALPEEFAAACEVLKANETVDLPGTGAGRKYSVGKLTGSSGFEYVIAVALLPSMGNNSAAIRATQLLFHCPNVNHIIMTGIAGAVPHPSKPDQHVRLGDIVVSDAKGVIQYDLTKESPEEIEHRHAPRPPSATLIEATRWLKAKELAGERPWDAYIEEGIRGLGVNWVRPGEDADRLRDWTDFPDAEHPKDAERIQGKPRVFQGPIASANTLLKNPVKRDMLRDKFKVKAVEMEGSGVADSTWTLEKSYLVVRGACDYCNPDKGDQWHLYAAVIAAAYTRSIIETLAPA